MSVQTLAWVLEDAAVPHDDGTVTDVPAELVSTLLGLANHADQNGRHAYPSQATLAHYTRKSERQVRRDLTRLEELGLVRRGDQRLVLHIDPDRRPVVWDLAVEVKRDPRPAPGARGARRPAAVLTRAETEADLAADDGITAGQNGGTSVSPRSDDEQRGDTGDRNGGTPVTERGDTHVRGTVQEPPNRTNEVVTEVGNGTSATSPTIERPSPSCTLDHAPGAACGACRTDRLALQAYEATLTAADRDRARQLAEADRAAARRAREDAEREAGGCGLCDAEGTAPVIDEHGQPLGTVEDPITCRCQHDAAANLATYRARLSCRAAVPATRATAAPRARTRARTLTAATAAPQEA